MSKYTTEVRYICETYAGRETSGGYNDIETILDESYDKVFSFDYPIFDTNYKKTLEKKILKHYYTREISEESVGLWKLRLDSRMNEIMPYYNQLYRSELLEFNPFYDFNVTTIRNSGSQEKQEDNRERIDNENAIRTEHEKDVFNGNKSGVNSENNSIKNDITSDKNSYLSDTENKERNRDNSSDSNEVRSNIGNNIKTETGKNVDKYSDTPQGAIAQIDLDTNAYLTNARIINDDKSSDEHNVTNENGKTESNENEKENEFNNRNTFENEQEKKSNDSNESKNKTMFENKDEENQINKDVVNNSVRNRNENRNKTAENLMQYAESVIGKKSGISYSKMLTEFRDTFLNIDAMVIEELKDLFFGLWE